MPSASRTAWSIAAIVAAVLLVQAATAAAALPDGRAYEQATPVDKNGTNAEGGVNLVQAARGGGAVTFFSLSGIPGGEGAQEFPIYVARRGLAGWSTEGLLPPAGTGPLGKVEGWDEELSTAFVTASQPAFTRTFYLRTGGALQPIATDTVEPAFAGVSFDGSTAVFETTAALLAGAVPGKPNVYAWDRPTGALHLAGTLNDGQAPAGGAVAGPYDWFGVGSGTESGGSAFGYYTGDAVFADGDGVFFTAAGTGRLYLRLNPARPQSPLNGEGECTDPTLACTVEVSASEKANGSGPDGTDPNGPLPAAFGTTASGGEEAFFTSPEELTNDANTGPDPAIARSNLDGSGVDQDFIPASAKGVAVDGAHVYWASPATDSIGRADIDGTNVEPAFITGADNPQGVAVNATHVYWTNAAGGANGAGSIGRAEIGGGNVDQSLIAGAHNPQGIALDATHVFWANAGATLATRRIGRAKLDGSEASQSFVNVTGVGNPQGVAVDATSVYWTRPNGGTIGRANLNGTSPNQSFVAGAANPQGVAVDATHLYWANADAGSIGRANVDGSGANQSFVAGAANPQGVAVDATHLYWVGNAGNPGNDLYRYDVASGTLTDLAPDQSDPDGADVLGVLGVSEDGEDVYFVANGVLAPGAAAGDCEGEATINSFGGSCSLYHWHDGTIELVARLDADPIAGSSDGTNWLPTSRIQPAFTGKTSRVSQGGETLLFTSRRQLTAYDNEDQPQVYRYRAGEPGLTCVSCNPSGAPPAGPASLQSIQSPIAPVSPASFVTRNLVAGGERVFFESPDPLVAEDVNGVLDVYEWEADGTGSCTGASQNGGCLYLISTGTSTEPSNFADASASGDDAFFFTSQRLVGQDADELVDVYDARVGGGLAAQNQASSVPCAGEGCRGPSSLPPAAQAPGSASFVGPGNRVRPRKARKRCGKGKRRVRRARKVRCVRRKRTKKASIHRREDRARGPWGQGR